MAYDPNFPASHEELTSPAFRAQFNGLNDKIEAVPAGPPGAPGQGFVFRGTWDGTASYMPYDVATHAGTAFLSVAVVSPTSTEPQDDVRWVVFAQRGSDGTPGGPGEQGIQGAPGEVTSAAMDSAIATAITDTARNPSGIAPFSGTFSDPPTQAEMQAFAAWSESLRAALMR